MYLLKLSDSIKALHSGLVSYNTDNLKKLSPPKKCKFSFNWKVEVLFEYFIQKRAVKHRIAKVRECNNSKSSNNVFWVSICCHFLVSEHLLMAGTNKSWGQTAFEAAQKQKAVVQWKSILWTGAEKNPNICITRGFNNNQIAVTSKSSK